MTNAAKTSGTATAAAPAKAWPQRFGTMTNVQIKTSRKGEYAIITVDCTKFIQVAFVFGAKLVAEVKAAGIGSKIWFKGPIEAVEKTNADGGKYTEDQMKVVYFKNKSAAASEDASKAAETTAPEDVAVASDDLTAIKGVGAGIAAKLADAGVATFTALAAMSNEDLDAIGAGTATRAENGDWRGQATAMSADIAAAEAEAADAAVDAAVDEEIPF
jgi:predicted flap endonuclease-1-like 5' DNA nuclease